jgi:hypothetical protein
MLEDLAQRPAGDDDAVAAGAEGAQRRGDDYGRQRPSNR